MADEFIVLQSTTSTQNSGLFDFLLPKYQSEGKSYVTIGVGCTGGRHRSVAIAEELGRRLRDGEHDVSVRHRDMDR